MHGKPRHPATAGTLTSPLWSPGFQFHWPLPLSHPSASARHTARHASSRPARRPRSSEELLKPREASQPGHGPPKTLPLPTPRLPADRARSSRLSMGPRPGLRGQPGTTQRREGSPPPAPRPRLCFPLLAQMSSTPRGHHGARLSWPQRGTGIRERTATTTLTSTEQQSALCTPPAAQLPSAATCAWLPDSQRVALPRDKSTTARTWG